MGTTDLMLRGEVGDDVGEGAVECALSVEGALELQEGAVPLVRRLLGQGERLLAPHRVISAMREGKEDLERLTS